MALFDQRMHDGSRFFADAPFQFASLVKQRLQSIHGAAMTDCIDTPLETWIDFNFRGHSFTMHSQWQNDYWLFVKDPGCPDDVLEEVARMLA